VGQRCWGRLLPPVACQARVLVLLQGRGWAALQSCCWAAAASLPLLQSHLQQHEQQIAMYCDSPAAHACTFSSIITAALLSPRHQECRSQNVRVRWGMEGLSCPAACRHQGCTAAAMRTSRLMCSTLLVCSSINCVVRHRTDCQSTDHQPVAVFLCTRCASIALRCPSHACSLGVWKWYCSSSSCAPPHDTLLPGSKLTCRTAHNRRLS
jgi:hypothetical protein